jgi:hypothetical protein
MCLLLAGLGVVKASAQVYEWERQEGGWSLRRGGETVGEWSLLEASGLEVTDDVEVLRPGVFRLKRVVRNAGEAPVEGVRLVLDFVHAGSSQYAMIPAVSYDGNAWGRGGEPKGFAHEGTWWTFSSRRTPIPGATYSEGDRWAVALWAESPLANPLPSCALMPEADRTTHRLIWPEEEQPLTYSDRDRFAPGTRETLSLQPDRTLPLHAILVVDTVQPGHRAMATFLAEAWRQNRPSPAPPPPPERLWDLAIRYAKGSLWAEEGSFRGFSIGLHWQDDAWVQRPGWKYEIGWCGQNASLANSLLVDHLRTGDAESLEKGLACLDTWAAHAPLSNGLFRTHFDYVLGITQGREILDACNLGTAAQNYFEAHDLAGRCGHPRPAYEELALGICRFMVRDQQPDGAYGKGWTPDGECVYRDGTIGAFLIPPMLEAFQRTGEAPYLQSAERAFAFYYGDFVARGFTSAGALDTWCIDKESAMPLLRAGLRLHELTSKPTYLEAAEHVSWYLSTWLWHTAAAYPAHTDFVRYGYDPVGGTAVSTQHHHLDPYAMFWVADWLELAEKTGNLMWAEKARAIWANANQLVSDGSTVIHERQRPAGSQNEAYFHAAWKQSPGSMNDWLVAWPTAFRLETLRRIETWDTLLPGTR